jgi:hypothetical protein
MVAWGPLERRDCGSCPLINVSALQLLTFTAVSLLFRRSHEHGMEARGRHLPVWSLCGEELQE